MKTYVILNRYYGTQAEAKAAAKEGGVKFEPEVDTVEVPTDKDGLIAYLNGLASQIGRQVEDTDEYVTVVERQDPQRRPGYRPSPEIDRGVALDEAFEAAPLGQQLTLAGIALENAFINLGKGGEPKAPQVFGRKAAETAPVDDELFA